MLSSSVRRIPARISAQGLAIVITSLTIAFGVSNASAESDSIVSPRDPQSGLPTGSTATSGKTVSGNPTASPANNAAVNKGRKPVTPNPASGGNSSQKSPTAETMGWPAKK